MSKEAIDPPPERSGSAAESGDSGIGSEKNVSVTTRLSDYLGREVDSKQADLISIYACFLTGFTSSVSFSVRLYILGG